MSTAPLLVLASRSVRRAQLLREAGYRFVQVLPPFEDPPQPVGEGVAAAQAAAVDLAMQKARSVLESDRFNIEEGEVILAADTIVVGPDGRWLGQPHDRDDARRMLLQLINKTHYVLTGVGLLAWDRHRSAGFCEHAQVHLGMLEDQTLQAYLDSGLWEGKAGGYHLLALQQQWPFTVQGDPTTVAGLPMQQLAKQLARWGRLKPTGQPDATTGAKPGGKP